MPATANRTIHLGAATLSCLMFGALPANATTAPSKLNNTMSRIQINGMEIANAEYLNFIGNAPIHYPEDAIVGFYPEEVSAEALACASEAYGHLKQFLEMNPAELRDAMVLGATPIFTLWVDDYSRSSRRPTSRVPGVWHYSNGAYDLTAGDWKWESIVDSEGQCHTPTIENAQFIFSRAAIELADSQPTH